MKLVTRSTKSRFAEGCGNINDSAGMLESCLFMFGQSDYDQQREDSIRSAAASLDQAHQAFTQA